MEPGRARLTSAVLAYCHRSRFRSCQSGLSFVTRLGATVSVLGVSDCAEKNSHKQDWKIAEHETSIAPNSIRNKGNSCPASLRTRRPHFQHDLSVGLGEV